jgi:hypothetical protein
LTALQQKNELKIKLEELSKQLSVEEENVKIQRKQQEKEGKILKDIEQDYEYKKKAIDENKKWSVGTF